MCYGVAVGTRNLSARYPLSLLVDISVFLSSLGYRWRNKEPNSCCQEKNRGYQQTWAISQALKYNSLRWQQILVVQNSVLLVCLLLKYNGATFSRTCLQYAAVMPSMASEIRSLHTSTVSRLHVVLTTSHIFSSMNFALNIQWLACSASNCAFIQGHELNWGAEQVFFS